MGNSLIASLLDLSASIRVYLRLALLSTSLWHTLVGADRPLPPARRCLDHAGSLSLPQCHTHQRVRSHAPQCGQLLRHCLGDALLEGASGK